jgi:CelD/BcsL family acetyltransferase involved in cellulose biosynthesis
MRLLRPETISESNALIDFEAEWNGLFQKVDSASPFQSPDWLLTWWKHFPHGELRILTLREADELVAVFPLYIETKPSGTRELKCIGAGISDYLEPLVAPDCESECFEHFVEWLVDTTDEWDKCILEGLCAESKLLTDEFGQAIHSEPCLCRQLPTTIDEWRNSISPKLNENIRYSWHRAERTEPLRLHFATAENSSESVDRFFDLHNARWAAARPNLDNAELLDFYREVAARMTANGTVQLYILCWGDQNVSGVFGFVHRGTFYIHLTAYDPRLAKYSFGSLVINAAIERAIEERCGSVDFLRGREDYKYRFGAKEKAMVTFCCTAEALRKKRGGALLFR